MKYDLIVIGGGSGLNVMSAAAARGLKVAIVEEGPLGGTCLNRGCIPSKILIHAADVIQNIKHASDFGVNVDGFSVDFERTMKRSFVVDEDAREIEKNIEKAENIDLYKGRGVFTGMKTLKVGDKEISADKIVIAAGTRPSIPPVEGLDSVPYMTSREVLRMKELPPELIVIGGGYIACELAYFFGAMGSKVKILQRNVRLLPHEDQEIGEKFTRLFSKEHEVHLQFSTAKVEKKGDRIVAYSKDGKSVEGTHLLIATGRTPNTDILQVEKTGVQVNKHGYISPNEFMQTNVDGIWVLGDIAGIYLFKHSANLEAQYVSYNLFAEKPIPVDYTAMPHAVFSYPQIAGVGYTEQQLKEEKKQYLVGRYMYKDSGMGTAMEEKHGFVKFLADGEGKILGCHIMGPEASTLIHEVLVSMKRGSGTLNDIIRTVHIHPALSEVVERAAGEV
jgi:dihydrolipoamide dehydrogenase